MSSFLADLRDWFTDTRRQAIYAAVAAVAPLLVYAGILADGSVGYALTLVQVILQVGAGVLAILNYTPRAAASWFVNGGRATVYALAVIAAPAAKGLGWITEQQSVSWLTATSLGLTALASVLSVMFIGAVRTPTTRV